MEKENVLENISVCLSQQGCCFVKGCHTPDFGKQMAQMDAEKCYETNVKHEIVQTRENER